MNLNATLLGQMITFAIFVWFTMKFVWPPIMKILDDRRQQVTDGLAAAEQGHRDLEKATVRAENELHEAKARANEIIEQANHRGHQLIEDAKNQARAEGEQLLIAAKRDADQQYEQARTTLQKQVADLVVVGASRLLDQKIDAQAEQKLLDDLILGERQ